MKNHRFDRYLYMGITAVLVLAAATAVIFLFLERKAILLSSIHLLCQPE